MHSRREESTAAFPSLLGCFSDSGGRSPGIGTVPDGAWAVGLRPPPGLGLTAALLLQGRGRPAQGHHAHHVVCRRLPPRGREGAAGAARRGRHPHPGAALLLLRCHPRHHDDVLHRDEGGEQGHPDMGK